MTNATTTTHEDERAIRDLVTRAQDLQNDTAGLTALHTDHTVIVNVAGRRVLGRDAFAAAMSAALATPMSDVRTTVEVTDIRFVTPDVALASCVKTIHDERPDSTGSLAAEGSLTYVLTRTEESGRTWRIALAQTTPVAFGTAS